MRIGTVSTSILLLFCLCLKNAVSFGMIDYQRMKPKGDDGTGSTATIIETTVALPTVPEVTVPVTKEKITVAPTTQKVETTTTLNPNIRLIDEAQRNAFLANSNNHRDVHLAGRFAFVWSWDPTLVESATDRIVNECEPKIDNSDELEEMKLTYEEFRKIGRDKKTLHPKMMQVYYQIGIARVGCAGRVNCKNGTTTEEDTFYFCHFAPSNFTADASFSTGLNDKCEKHATYSNLCLDVPKKAAEYVTALPVRIVYMKKSTSSEFGVLSLMISLIFVGIFA
ncbi:hypothetical protein B9Z55_008971 [Caenorhabditis nigoni]|uniref:SCP domain-containing protein n=1 Tax=Caenorhabditis nigoni TaxID=1611254 RepID=A0A2G5UQS5_9PELO|nr:hypothetical protein B9Z55_008971 [Caenorhabditis nigoni]